MTDQIILTREEVREARDKAREESRCFAEGDCFLEYDESCEKGWLGGICDLCKRLAEFAEGGDEEIRGKGGES